MLKSKCKFCDNNKAIHAVINNNIKLSDAINIYNTACKDCKDYRLYKPRQPVKDSACEGCSKYKKCQYLDKGYIKQCSNK